MTPSQKKKKEGAKMASKTNVKNQISQAYALLINETKTDWIFFLKPTVYKASQAYHIV